MGCKECCHGCCRCLSRIPYGTTVGIAISLLGMFLFVGGLVEAVKHVNKIAEINGILDFSYKVAGIVIAVGMGLALVIFLVGCLTSGATRDNLYSGVKSKLAGKFFTCLVMLLEYILYISWSLITSFMMAPIILIFILIIVCNLPPIKEYRECIDLQKYGLADLMEAVSGKANLTICGKALDNFCNNTRDAETPLIVALVGSLIAALGTVHVLMCLSANFAYVNAFVRFKKGKNDESGDEMAPRI